MKNKNAGQVLPDNQTNCHSRVLLSGIPTSFGNTQGGDPRQRHSGMTVLLNNSGFTLIELLVVVLIIGILVAVALPQYNKIVEHSRMTEAVQRLGDYAMAQQVYYLHHGGFANNYSALNQGDIRVPEQTEVGNWDTGDSRWEISSASGDNLEKIAMSAERMSGIFQGCVLTLTVEADGRIEKMCQGNKDCCAAAQDSGYEKSSAETSSGSSSGESSLVSIITPSQTDVACKGNYGICSIYEWNNGTLEVSNEYVNNYMEVLEYDENGTPVTGGGYHADGSCSEGPKCANGGSICEFYPTLDICNN